MVNHILDDTGDWTLCRDYGGHFAHSVSAPPENASCPECRVKWSGAAPAADPVNHPAHYNWLANGVEVIDITETLSFTLGNVVKYVLRADHKGKPIEDLEKAAWYLAREIARRKKSA